MNNVRIAQDLILLVEDDENDAFFVRIALEDADIKTRIHVVQSGREAIDYLAGNGCYADRGKYPLPSVILLDLNLPLVSGGEVLCWLRQKSEVPQLPVIVLTSSALAEDMVRCYQQGANAFVVEPCSAAERLALFKAIKAFWLECNRVPTLTGI